jgi:hypothetical protein
MAWFGSLLMADLARQQGLGRCGWLAAVDAAMLQGAAGLWLLCVAEACCSLE